MKPRYVPGLATPEEACTTLGGVPAAVSFSGLAPGFVGLYQGNIQVPENASTGNSIAVVLSIEGAISNTVSLAVQ